MPESSLSKIKSKFNTRKNYKDRIIIFLFRRICPSSLNHSLGVHLLKKARIYIILKIYNFLVTAGTNLAFSLKKHCPPEDRQRSPQKKRNTRFIKKRAILITGYFLQEEPSITVLFLLSICFTVATVVKLFCADVNFVGAAIELFLLFLTYIWLFHRLIKDIYSIMVRKGYYSTSKDMRISDDDGANDRLREVLNAEAEGYQQEKRGYFSHLEQTAQKIRHEYGVETNSDMNINFFAKLAGDLKYEVKIVAKESSGKFPNGLNGFVYSDIDLEKNDQADKKDGNGPEKHIIVMSRFTDQDKPTMQYLLHELGHAIVGTHNVVKNGSAQTRSIEINRYREALRNERDANYFAAAMLICEYKARKLLKIHRYDLIKIMNNSEYYGLSYETIAHRAISLSDIDFHAFKIAYDENEKDRKKRYRIIKKYTCSGLDFNTLELENSSAGLCIQEAKNDENGNKANICYDLYAKISMIPNKAQETNEYFCFAKELPPKTIRKNDRYKKLRIAYVVGCTVDAAEKANLFYYERYKELNPCSDQKG